MVKRRRLEAPSSADLDQIERQFRSETSGRPALGRGIAPIAQIAAESAAEASIEAADARVARARLEADSDRLREAQEQGLLMVELPVEQIDEAAMIRDRMAVSEEDLQELQQSIAANGLRLPIEVFELENPGRAGRRYGLLSGYRRLLAVRGLYDLTGSAPYGTIRALIRPRADADAAFVAMVEENEVREELSHFERGRIAVIAANQGAFVSTEEAVEKMFATGSKAKRSKVRSFSIIFDELGDMLQFPEELTERRGLRLAAMLRRGGAAQLRHALSEHPPADGEEEWQIIEPLVAEAEKGPRDTSRGGRPKSKPAEPAWQTMATVRTANGITIRRLSDADGHTLRFEGGGLSAETMDRLVFKIQDIIES